MRETVKNHRRPRGTAVKNHRGPKGTAAKNRRMSGGTAVYKKKIQIKLIAAGICLAAAVLLQLAARNFSGFAEFYAAYIYPVWVNTLGRLMAFFPVSMVEILLYILIFLSVLWLIRLVFFRKGRRRQTALQGFLTAIVFASALFLSYTVNCGINYHRHTFAEESGLEMKERTAEELLALCEKLTDEVNGYSAQIKRNKKGLCVLETEQEARAVSAMQAAAGEFPALDGYYPKPKGVIVSQILSYQQLTGVYSPFTVEANYNRHMISYNKPFTMCHELSHLRGFMREDEANFIAYIACMASDDIDFNYSGALTGWVYATNALYKVDEVSYHMLYERLLPEVKAELAANSAFWDSYDGKIAEAADKVNDTYLKANNQTDGVQSYSRMVDLMLAYEDRGGNSDDDIN